MIWAFTHDDVMVHVLSGTEGLWIAWQNLHAGCVAHGGDPRKKDNVVRG